MNPMGDVTYGFILQIILSSFYDAYERFAIRFKIFHVKLT